MLATENKLALQETCILALGQAASYALQMAKLDTADLIFQGL